MARRVKTTTAVLILDHTTGTYQVLNTWKVDDPTVPGLTQDDSLPQPRTISGSELTAALSTFISNLLNEAKTKSGI